MVLGLGLLLALAVPAPASTGHRYAGQFSSPGLLPGELVVPSGLAIRQSTGDVYVLDAGNARVERFNAAGDFLSSFDGSATPATAFASPNGIAVDQSTGDVYVADTGNNAVDVFSAAGAYLSQLDATATPATVFASPYGVAVDPANGTVYVSDTGDNVVDVFDNAGAFVTSFDGSTAGDGPFAGPAGIAVDASHRVYVLDSGKARVEKYTAQGAAFTSVFDSVSPVAVAVDPTSAEVYVGESGPAGIQVSEFTSSGAAISTFGPPHIAATSGIGVNATTGTVYVADQANWLVDRFSAFIAPTVTTEGAGEIEATEATLACTINPEGIKASYRFEYGTEATYGNASPQPDAEAGEGSADVEATTTLTGLAPGTTYHYRLVGTNASGSSVGADQTFTTSAAQASVDVQPSFASAIGTTGATLNATLNPNGADTTYRFEYGATTGYGTTTEDGDAGSVTGEAPVAVPVTGLAPATTYHFRVVAENGVGGSVQGADATFTTAAAATPAASGVTASSATLNASVIPGAGGASYRFEYGTSASYGASTLETGIAAGSSEVPVSAEVIALTPGTEYHFRLVASVNGQSVASEDATFTTLAAPTVTTSVASAVTPTTVTVNATIDTHGVAGTASFAIISPESAFATTTTPVALSASSGPQSVSVAVSGLPAGAEYLVRASASIPGNTTWGEQVTFTTPQLPPFSPPAPAPGISGNPYGCIVPHLDPVNAHPKAGASLAVTGSDLGVGGTIALGSTLLQPTSWSASAITFHIPDTTTGAQSLTINCGAVSNTIALAVTAAPSSTFRVTAVHVSGSTATLTISVPGAGKLHASAGASTAATKKTAKASTVKLTVHLSNAGKRALTKARGKTLKVSLRITFTPTGGKAAGATKTITFKRAGTR